MQGKLRVRNNIRKLRFFAGEMTQQELAEKAGVSRQTIIAMEADKYSPSLELAFRIALAFGVSITEVFECETTGANT
ncbi:MAG: helix-turn-helix transcriptional regulator [Spirochaetes bacterium]|nr:helix-turn-helix transcriptional regulator [Spirochaetota bacterium]MBU0956890.1 helix-turn-helix transcriptional regulator [Spirochaetota bacterium]